MRSTNPRKFFTKEEGRKIMEAIQAAEKNTSGEIRLHLEAGSKKEPLERAKEVFAKIGMAKTEKHNGVLVYLDIKKRAFAILGDKGINDVVPENFWEEIKGRMAEEFKKDDFAGGISYAITQAGENLKKYFPYQLDDVNELPDDISFG